MSCGHNRVGASSSRGKVLGLVGGEVVGVLGVVEELVWLLAVEVVELLVELIAVSVVSFTTAVTEINQLNRSDIVLQYSEI